MKTRKSVMIALSVATFAVLVCQTTSYALVYPAQQHGKLSLGIALAVGSALAASSSALSFVAWKRATRDADRLFALLGLGVSLFFLFVMVAGFGIPELFLTPRD